LVENVHRGGVVRRGGALVGVPAAWRTRTIDFGRGPRSATTIPWGDVSTAFHSTGIPDVEVYLAMRPAMRRALVVSRFLGPLLALAPLQRLLKARIRSGPAGPSAAHREQGECLLWGEAMDAEGRTAVSRLRTPEGYELTALTALAIVERVLQGDAPPGYQTPSRAYGPDFILGIPGCERSDEPLAPS
jgi:short subunit dehydrogenase-like uncharacterized protein